MKLLFVLFVFIAAATCLPSPQRVVVIPSHGLAQSAEQFGNYLLRNKYDIRGHYESIVVLILSDDQLEAVKKEFPTAAVVSSYHPVLYSYYVLEKKSFEYATPGPIKVSQHAKIVWESDARVVARVLKINAPRLLNSLPRDVFVLPIAEITMAPPADETLLKEIYANVTSMLAPNPIIVQLISQVSTTSIRTFNTYLTGEASSIVTRTSPSQGARDAATWIQSQFQLFKLTTSTHSFRTDYAPNVIGILRGTSNPNSVVVVGAHYDGRAASSTSTTARAPGSNDNGSGSTAVLQIAKIISDFGARFAYTIHFVLFSGEEQGLLGSAAYATKLTNEGVSVIAMVNADMISYRRTGEAMQCAFPNRYHTPTLTSLLQTTVREYTPELIVGTTTACCSDHQSFFQRGYAATAIFERNGAIADPMYHNVGDLFNRAGIDLNGQYQLLVKAYFAMVATLAVPA